MQTFWQELRYGLRMLWKAPGFTAAAVLTLALGIGANTAIFTVVNAFLFRPLAIQNANRLTVLAVQRGKRGIPAEISYPDYRDYQQQSDAFTDIGAYVISLRGLASRGHADRIVTSYVTSNYFSMLGVRPAVGRLIRPGEGDQPNTGSVVVLGHHYWERRFASNPDVVGSTMTLDGQPVTIIGVVPKEFRGTFAIVEMDAYVPIGMLAANSHDTAFFTDRGQRELHVLGVLKPGVTVRQAQASLNVITQQLAKQYPQNDKDQLIHVYPERLARPTPSAGRSVPVAAGAFLTLVALVLLIACVNVANLLLARAATRHKEMAIRAALGAARFRLVRQMLTESILLAIAGGAGGALLGNWVCHGLESLRPIGDFPVRFGLTFDWRVFSYVAGVALLAGIIAGLAPAMTSSRIDLNATLREGGRGMDEGGGRHPIRHVFVIAQVGGSVALLVATGLFVRSLTRAATIDLGFDSHNVLNIGIDPGLEGYDQSRAEAFFRELLRRAKAVPGVESVALAFTVPMNYYSMGAQVFAEGQTTESDSNIPEAGYNIVDPQYFSTLRIPLLQGRAFTAADTSKSEPVGVVNQTMAEQFWPNQDPVGRRFRYKSSSGPLVTVVGVARNGKYGEVLEPPAPYFYVPQAQEYRPSHVLQVRTSVPPESLVAPIEEQIRDLDPHLPVFDVMTMDRTLAGVNGFFLFRVGAVFAGVLGGLAFLIAVVGLYEVVSFTATRRTHEIGVRMALGALPRNIFGLMLRQVLSLVGAGLGLGMVAAFCIARLLSGLVVGVSPYDPMTFATVSISLVVVALLACYLPARRAMRVDPMVALRYE